MQFLRGIRQFPQRALPLVDTHMYMDLNFCALSNSCCMYRPKEISSPNMGSRNGFTRASSDPSRVTCRWREVTRCCSCNNDRGHRLRADERSWARLAATACTDTNIGANCCQGMCITTDDWKTASQQMIGNLPWCMWAQEALLALFKVRMQPAEPCNQPESRVHLFHLLVKGVMSPEEFAQGCHSNTKRCLECLQNTCTQKSAHIRRQ